MSLFVVSSDWRFKEKFKFRYRSSFVSLFSMTEKAMYALRLENCKSQLNFFHWESTENLPAMGN